MTQSRGRTLLLFALAGVAATAASAAASPGAGGAGGGSAFPLPQPTSSAAHARASARRASVIRESFARRGHVASSVRRTLPSRGARKGDLDATLGELEDRAVARHLVEVPARAGECVARAA